MLPTTETERESLSEHVSLCALRYQNLEARIDKIETKLDLIETKIDNFKTEIATIIIRGGIGLIIFLSGALATTLKLLGHF